MNYMTRNGYNYYDVVSAFQKAIRRGEEELAVQWAIELETYNTHLLWKRLEIIASEDIGPANDMMAILVGNLRYKYDSAVKGKSQAYRLYLIHAVLSLCRSEKSREVDEMICIYYPKMGVGADLPKIPDYAYDMHTLKGKRMNRGLEHFYQESAKIAPVSEEWKERAAAAGDPGWFSKYTSRTIVVETAPGVADWWKTAEHPWSKKEEKEDGQAKDEKQEKQNGKTLGDFLR